MAFCFRLSPTPWMPPWPRKRERICSFTCSSVRDMAGLRGRTDFQSVSFHLEAEETDWKSVLQQLDLQRRQHVGDVAGDPVRPAGRVSKIQADRLRLVLVHHQRAAVAAQPDRV